MYTIVLSAAVAALIFIIVAIKSKTDFWGLFFFTFVIGLLGGAIGIIIALVVGLFVPTHIVTYGPATLVSVRTSDGISGAFVWGTGSIQNASTYNFMMLNADGTISPGSVPANGLVHIGEDANLHNVGYWSQVRREADQSSKLCPWALGQQDATVILSEDFRVPAGTVRQNFNMQ